MRSSDPISPERLEELLRGIPPETEREARVQGLVRELRAGTPPASDAVRERVRALRAPAPQRWGWLTWRRAALVLAPATVAVVGALLVPRGETPSGSGDQSAAPAQELSAGSAGAEPDVGGRDATAPKAAPSEARARGALESLSASPVPTTDRAQDVDVFLEVRVPNRGRLEDANGEATRIARELGGHVVTASFGTTGQEGLAELTLRVPTRKVQEAIARYSELGTVTGQRIDIQDRQAEIDARARQIEGLRRSLRILDLRLAGTNLTAEQRLQLELARERQRARLSDLLRTNRRVVRGTQMADLSVRLHTGTAPAKEEGTRFDDAVGAALDVLTVVGAGAIFMAIVLAPALVLFVLVWLLVRAARRRRDERLLEAPRPHAPPS